jgi:hypothetical protein
MVGYGFTSVSSEILPIPSKKCKCYKIVILGGQTGASVQVFDVSANRTGETPQPQNSATVEFQ